MKSMLPVASVAAGLIAILLAGCGQKGPLFLPGEDPQNRSESSESSETQAPSPGTVDEVR